MALMKEIHNLLDATSMPSRLRALLPQDKMDIEAVEKITDYGYPTIEPILPLLIEWMQDFNWPVAQALAPFLAGIGPQLKSSVLDVLKTQDAIWIYWVVSKLVNTTDLRLAEAIFPELVDLYQKTANSADEDEQAVSLAVGDILNRLQK